MSRLPGLPLVGSPSKQSNSNGNGNGDSSPGHDRQEWFRNGVPLGTGDKVLASMTMWAVNLGMSRSDAWAIWRNIMMLPGTEHKRGWTLSHEQEKFIGSFQSALEHIQEEKAEREDDSEKWWGSPAEIPEDITSLLDPLHPVIGAMENGQCLLYPGRTHNCYSSTEAGKTWLATFFAAQEIMQGYNVAYLDFEDCLEAVVQRLAVMVPSSKWYLIRKHFRYYRPNAALPPRTEFLASLAGCSFVILDGVTEALSLQCGDVRNVDIAKLNAAYGDPIAAIGPAVLYLDHESKSAGGQGPIDSVHKLNAITGASFTLISWEPFGIGLDGRSELYIRKDRPAQLRRFGNIPDKEGLVHIGELRVNASSGTTEVSLVDWRSAMPEPTVITKEEKEKEEEDEEHKRDVSRKRQQRYRDNQKRKDALRVTLRFVTFRYALRRYVRYVPPYRGERNERA